MKFFFLFLFFLLCGSSYYISTKCINEFSFYTEGQSFLVDGDSLNNRACHVIILNNVDFHYEVIESTVLRFPLPFHEFNCSVTKFPIIYDFSLYDNRFHLKIGGLASPFSLKAKFLNQTEFWGWKKYFDRNLKGQTFPKNDKYKSKALFRNLINYEEKSYPEVDAVIDVTCDASKRFQPWLLSSDNNYCVLHGANKKILSKNPSLFLKSCFLSPMWPREQCQFAASDLPFARENVKSVRLEKPGVKICVLGGNRNLTLACEMFSKSMHDFYNATLHFSLRDKIGLPKIIRSFGIKDKASIYSEIDYIKYHEHLTKCDLILPLREPNESSSHFPWGGKKSSGIVPVIIAYQIDVLAHYKFIKIYEHWFSKKISVISYRDDIDNMVSGLNKQMFRISQRKIKP